MCGIAGVLDLKTRESVSSKALEKMSRALAHRGPDDYGIWIDGYCGLAHRRLAVIDPSPAGHQPMVSPDGSLGVVFNGTIYNFHELRGQLQSLGYRFVSRCDTEVLVHGWREWGADLVPRLNGHFAFAVWDRTARKLFLVRDRFGTKPLYYAKLGDLWLFGSEIGAILSHQAYSPAMNYDALCEYFTFQNLFRHHTLFDKINLVPQANIISVNADDGSWQRGAYWDYDFSHPDGGIDEVEAQREVARLLSQATKRQLLSDVPVGAYLSGGLDSGSVVTMAAREIPHIKTFTCGWHLGGVDGAEANFDERAQAEAIAYRCHTEHFEQVVGHADVPMVMPDLVGHLEDLRLGMSYGQYFIARLASKFVKVCLTGAGSDEVFGGYPWRYFRVSRSLGQKEFFSDYYHYWQRLVLDEERKDFFTRDAYSRIKDFDTKNVLSRVFTFNPVLKFAAAEDHVANSLYFECKTFLPSLLLVGDRLSMAHGLEERHPFLDNDLVEFAQKIPVRYKLRDLDKWKRYDENLLRKHKGYYALHDDGKNVLRKALGSLMPNEVLKRPKQGFSSPDESWYRGGNLAYVKKLLLDRRAVCHEYIEPKTIARIVAEHSEQGVNHRLLIWSLTCFENWLKAYLV